MKTLKFFSGTQFIILAMLWFFISMAFQAEEVYREANYFNIIDISVSAIVILIAVFFIYILQKYTSAYFNNLFTRMSLLVVLLFKIIFIENFLVKRLINDPGYQEIFSETIYIRIFTAFLVLSFFSFVLWLLFHMKKINAEIVLKQTAENSLRDAELMKLRQQIQPHFLFNSLNSINALVGSEPGQARQMIQNLSDFLRGTLKKDENKNVLLSEEIELLKLYLEIEKVRFGHRLKIHFSIDEPLLKQSIPPLLLQPIVENAVKFGLYNVLNDVEITVSGELKNKLLEIVVINPFDESTATTRKGEGFGLNLIQRRLQLIYHRTDLLRTEKNNNIFKTTILIPQA